MPVHELQYLHHFRFRSGSRQIAEPEKFAAVIAGYIAKEMDSASEKAVLAELLAARPNPLPILPSVFRSFRRICWKQKENRKTASHIFFRSLMPSI